MKNIKQILIAIFIMTTVVGVGNLRAEGPGLAAGETAPDFTAPTAAGGQVTLSEVYQKGSVVLVFYRGAWCPYCNLHLQSFQKRIEDFKKLGASVIAVSVDKPNYGKAAVEKSQLSFDVISDPQADILKAYNVVFQVPAELAQKYKNEYHLDLEAHSGRTDGVIAVPATYVIDTTGKIIFAYASEDYKVRTQPEEVLAVLRA